MVNVIPMMSAKLSQLVTVVYLISAILTISANPSSRIVGGKNADIGQFPYQVALLKGRAFICGGSIISARYILTAAQCVVVGNGIEALPGSYFNVRVGSIQRQGGGKLLKVKKVTVRESYGNFLDDVALLELEEELEFTSNVQPIELYDGEVPSGEPVVVSGWGSLTSGGMFPNRLQFNTLTAINEDECKEQIPMGEKQIICLSHPEDNGVCNGDFGGPAQYQGKLVGVAGFLYSACGSIYPDGYANINYHRDWIRDNIV